MGLFCTAGILACFTWVIVNNTLDLYYECLTFGFEATIIISKSIVTILELLFSIPFTIISMIVSTVMNLNTLLTRRTVSPRTIRPVFRSLSDIRPLPVPTSHSFRPYIPPTTPLRSVQQGIVIPGYIPQVPAVVPQPQSVNSPQQGQLITAPLSLQHPTP